MPVNIFSGWPRNDDDGPLKVSVEGKELVIRVGLQRLKWCLVNDDGPMSGCKIRRADDMAEAICEAANKSDDLGFTPLSTFLDSMAKAASDSGSPHIIKLSPAEAKIEKEKARGYKAAKLAIAEDGGTLEAAREHRDVAREDLKPDAFTKGWKKACDEIIYRLESNEKLIKQNKTFLND